MCETAAACFTRYWTTCPGICVLFRIGVNLTGLELHVARLERLLRQPPEDD